MIKCNVKNNKGFTLIEGLVALAVLAIFIPLFYSLNSYINKSFSVANRQSDLQFYTRLAKTKIENEIAFVPSLTILPSNPDVIPADYTVICVNNDKKIVIRTANTDNVTIETALMEVPSEVEMVLSFSKLCKKVDDVNVYGDKLLGFIITCSIGDDVVSLETSYQLKNNCFIGGESSGIAIMYKH